MDFQDFGFNMEKVQKHLSTLDSVSVVLTYLFWLRCECLNLLKDIDYYVIARNITDILGIDSISLKTRLLNIVKDDSNFHEDARKKQLAVEQIYKKLNEYVLCKIENMICFYKKLRKLEQNNSSIQNQSDVNKVEANGKTEKCLKEIIWCGDREQLLKLFLLLTKNVFIPEYNENVFLFHFKDLKNVPFLNCTDIINRQDWISENKTIYWLVSDNEFIFLINELRKNKLIKKYRKYKQFEGHFLNQNGENFRYPSQKKNFMDNFLNEYKIISEMVKQIGPPENTK